MSDQPVQPERTHRYHAEATVLEGNLTLPLVQQIYPQAFAKVPEEGGYLSQQAEEYRLEGVVSYRSAYTQVAGNRDEEKKGHGFSTLTTAVIEGLNILDVITADKIVAQLSTDHPLVGYVPTVTFLGTRFENLRIAGHPVKCHVDHAFLGPKPENDGGYTTHPGFLERVKKQHQVINNQPDVPAEIAARYNLHSSQPNPESMECSLVSQVEGGFPGRCFGHVIDVPNFGKVHLGVVKVEHSDPHPETKVPRKTTVHLHMIEANMGCIASGHVLAAKTSGNGTSDP